ncbi:MAG TPA: VOC family protein [Candidatus Baltobacteraceae bacterium]|nr:VOC family protein [Candidatus Baltobacteraceae bacterium]
MVRELAFSAYYVRDLSRAVAFYRDVLGLRAGDLANDEWFEFDLGNATFALDATGDALGIAPGSSSGAAFEVADVDGMRRRIAEAGFPVSDVHDFPPCRAAFARDPDGNRLIIHQRKARDADPESPTV